MVTMSTVITPVDFAVFPCYYIAMIWIIFLVIIVVVAVAVVSNANNPQRQLAALQEHLNGYPEECYQKNQEKLSKDFRRRYNKEEDWIFDNEKEFNERRNEDRVEYKENELWKRHVQTVLASDKYSLESKRNAVDAWFDFTSSRDRLNDAIEVGLDSDTMEQWAKDCHESRNTLTAVLAAFDFDLEKETKDITERVAKDFPVAPKKTSKAVSA